MIYNQLFTCVAYIVTGIGVLMTPTIADTIVTAGGAGNDQNEKCSRKNDEQCKTAILTAKTGGASTVAAATKSAAAGSASGMVNNAMKNSK